MKYSIKEIYLTLQGEGSQAGRAAVFCRFSGCNLWSGRESERLSAECQFCDTDFVGTDGKGGGKFNASEDLAKAINDEWGKNIDSDSLKLVVFTGGEPALQISQELVDALRDFSFECAIETNGTLPLRATLDWVTVSPKIAGELKVLSGHELKLIFPQKLITPEMYKDLSFKYFFLQPMDGLDYKENLRRTIAYCLKNPQWKLSIQTHKYIGID
jgi:7-carboxy-7-deazaguanine synthase (Cx14CxxC type)